MQTTTPEDYYQDRAAPPGSALHYALLYVPAGKRDAVAALCAFQGEVASIGREGRDAGVARVRLQWWRDEVARLFSGAPRHPITKTLAGAVDAYSLSADQFLEVINGAEMDLDYFSYATFQAVTLYYHRLASMPCLMAAQVLGWEDGRTLKYAHALGVCLKMSKVIRRLGPDAAAERSYVPADEMDECGVTLQDLAQGAGGPGVHRLVARQISRCREYYRTAQVNLAGEDRRRQCSGVILGEIAMATLRGVERDGYPVPGKRYTLTPVRKLWIAWRTHRRGPRPAPPAPPRDAG